MTMAKALELMEDTGRGYCVAYHTRMKIGYFGGHFPEVGGGEQPIATEAEAWKLAERFAKVDPSRFVDIYVIDSQSFKPVPGHESQILNRSMFR